MSAEIGQFLDDAKIFSFTKDMGHGEVRHFHYVFATYIEDSTQVDLDKGFSHQEIPDDRATYCPQCSAKITIYVQVHCLDGKTRLCHYCTECDLLFRTAIIGTLDNYGNFNAWESVR